jgi:hypothetical protein
MNKKHINWDRFEDEEDTPSQKLVRHTTPKKEVQVEAEIVPHKFTERETAQEYSRWERMGNRLVTDQDRTRFQEYLKRQALRIALARHNAKQPAKTYIQTPTPTRPETEPWALAPAFRDEKAISSDDLFSVPSVSVMQQISQKLLSFKDQLTEVDYASRAEADKSGLL